MNVAIITGSNGGIGQALIEAFKSAGYYTIGVDLCKSNIADVNLEYDLEKIVNCEEEQSIFFKDVFAAIGGKSLKVLINNAAIQILGNVDEVKLTDFKKTLDINVTAPFLLSKNLFDSLKSSAGCIINIGSIHAKLTKPNFISYATSKAALKGLTQAMAVDFGQHVSVNCIQPAAISTKMLTDGFINNPEGFKLLESYHPSGDIGNPEDIANLCCFLVESDIHFLNGETFSLDGGIGSRLHDPE